MNFFWFSRVRCIFISVRACACLRCNLYKFVADVIIFHSIWFLCNRFVIIPQNICCQVETNQTFYIRILHSNAFVCLVLFMHLFTYRKYVWHIYNKFRRADSFFRLIFLRPTIFKHEVLFLEFLLQTIYSKASATKTRLSI